MSDFNDKELENLGRTTTNNLPEDVTGQHPVPEYMYTSNANKEARGEDRNDLKLASGSTQAKEALADEFINSTYGLNRIQKSITGHSFEIDDTPGNERILIYHNSGAGVELRPDGGVSINSIGNKVDITGGDQVLVVEGDANVVYNGNVTMKVKGEFNIDCLDFNITTRGNKTENIFGSEFKTVSKGSINRVIGNLTNYVTEKQTDVILGNHQHNVKGDLENNIGQNLSMFSGGKMNVTAKTHINTTSDNISLSANNMTIQGGSGSIIGGEGVNFSGNNIDVKTAVTAPTFIGSLNGVALKSQTTSAQNYAEDTTSGTAFSGYTANSMDTFVNPDNASNTVANFVSKSQGGIRNVAIDDGNFIKDNLDKTVRYNGISNIDLTVEAARSKLRASSNRNNRQFIQSLLEEDTICRTYNDAVPPAVGRVLDGESSTLLSGSATDPIHPDHAAVHIPRYVLSSFPPDPKFNPFTKADITIATKIANGMSISKFLGTEDPTNMLHIKDLQKRKEIAAALYLQTIIFDKIKRNQKEFAGVSLEATEGLYKPGPTETIEKNSINDLKSQGRAVVYRAIDANGFESSERLFDIAAYLKDNAYFEQLILSYDSLDCDLARRPVITARLIITMPKLGSDYTGTFNREVSTEYNGHKLSQGELVECMLREPLSPIPNITYPVAGTSNNLIWSIPEAARRVDPILIQKLERVSIKFGKKLTVVSGFRNPKNPKTKSKGAGLTSQHTLGNAVDISVYGLNNQQRAQLLRIACDEGLTGIGIYTNKGAAFFGRSKGGELIHFDIRTTGKACWGDNLSRSSLYYYPWAYFVLKEKGFNVGDKEP